MNIDEAKQFLTDVVLPQFKDKSFDFYIKNHLAGDFAVELAEVFAKACSVKVAAPYAELGEQIGRLVEEKQAAYGDSFGKSGAVIRILYPKGISADQIDDALCIVRILDKLFRIATDRDALGESPYRDIAGYGLLGARRVEQSKGEAVRP